MLPALREIASRHAVESAGHLWTMPDVEALLPAEAHQLVALRGGHRPHWWAEVIGAAEVASLFDNSFGYSRDPSCPIDPGTT